MLSEHEREALRDIERRLRWHSPELVTDPFGDADDVASWLGEHCPDGDAEFALEGCTGWRYVSEELTAAGSARRRA